MNSNQLSYQLETLSSVEEDLRTMLMTVEKVFGEVLNLQSDEKDTLIKLSTDYVLLTKKINVKLNQVVDSMETYPFEGFSYCERYDVSLRAKETGLILQDLQNVLNIAENP